MKRPFPPFESRHKNPDPRWQKPDTHRPSAKMMIAYAAALIGFGGIGYIIGYQYGRHIHPPTIVADGAPVKALPPASGPDLVHDSLVLGLLDEEGKPVFSTADAPETGNETKDEMRDRAKEPATDAAPHTTPHAAPHTTPHVAPHATSDRHQTPKHGAIGPAGPKSETITQKPPSTPGAAGAKSGHALASSTASMTDGIDATKVPAAADSSARNHIGANAAANTLGAPPTAKISDIIPNIPPARDASTAQESVTTPLSNKPPKGGAYGVQFASLKDRDKALSYAEKITSQYAHLLGGAPVTVTDITIAGRGSFHRVQATSLPDIKAARKLCENLKTVKIRCLPVRMGKHTPATTNP